MGARFSSLDGSGRIVLSPVFWPATFMRSENSWSMTIGMTAGGEAVRRVNLATTLAQEISSAL